MSELTYKTIKEAIDKVTSQGISNNQTLMVSDSLYKALLKIEEDRIQRKEDESKLDLVKELINEQEDE